VDLLSSDNKAAVCAFVVVPLVAVRRFVACAIGVPGR
jgi:hypothetical protein